MTAPTPQPERPTFAFRVGITGARHLRDNQIERLSRQLQEFFAIITEEISSLQTNGRLKSAYAAGQPKLVFLSPLALGADRLAWRAAPKPQFTLYVPMPFAREVYETDFTGAPWPDAPPQSAAEDLAEFRELFSQAVGTLQLDGDKTKQIDRSYEMVGRFVVRHCDLLIAIWDGDQDNGRGGTADIVSYAKTTDVPVWWINATEDVPPVWIFDATDPPAEGTPARDRLSQWLRDEILPPPPVPRHRHN